METVGPQIGRLRILLWVVWLSCLVLAVFYGFYDRRIGGLVFNSVVLGFGSSLVAVPLGTFLGVALYRVQFPFRRLLLILVCSSTLIPLVLIASAWDAGFGRLGWWQWPLSGGAGGRLLGGLWIASWIHGVAAAPWVTLLVGMASGYSDSEAEDSLRLDVSTTTTLFQFVRARLPTFIVLGMMWVFVTTMCEIVVSDLYQVRTVAEEIYLGLPLAQNAVWGGVTSGRDVSQELFGRFAPFTLLNVCWVATCLSLLLKSGVRLGGNSLLHRNRLYSIGAARWLVLLAVLGLVGVMLGVPFVNLIAKAGFIVHQVDGEPVPGWQWQKFFDGILEVPRKYGLEFQWTAMIGLVVTLLNFLIGSVTSWIAYNIRQSQWVLAALLIGLLSLPGPVVGLGVIRLLNHDNPLMIFLYDRTILPPVLATLARVGPWIAIMLFGVWTTLEREQIEIAQTEGVGFWKRLTLLAIPQRWLLCLAIGLISFCMAVGELSASLLVLPPGMDTTARLVFGQLHAGVYDQVALLTIVQWGGFLLLGFCVFLLVSWQSHRRQIATAST